MVSNSDRCRSLQSNLELLEGEIPSNVSFSLSRVEYNSWDDHRSLFLIRSDLLRNYSNPDGDRALYRSVVVRLYPRRVALTDIGA